MADEGASEKDGGSGCDTQCGLTGVNQPSRWGPSVQPGVWTKTEADDCDEGLCAGHCPDNSPPSSESPGHALPVPASVSPGHALPVPASVSTGHALPVPASVSPGHALPLLASPGTTWHQASCPGVNQEPGVSSPGQTDSSATVLPQPCTQNVVAGVQAGVLPFPLMPVPLLSAQLPHPLSGPGGQPANVSYPLQISSSGQPTITSIPLHISSGQSVSHSVQKISQNRRPVQLKPKSLSPTYHNATEKLTASEILRQRARKKKTVVPCCSTVRSILPKGLAVTSDPQGSDQATDSSPGHSGLKIERVYYTSKGGRDLFAEIKVAENALHPAPLTKEFEMVHCAGKQAASGVDRLCSAAVRGSAPSPVSATHTTSTPSLTATHALPRASLPYAAQSAALKPQLLGLTLSCASSVPVPSPLPPQGLQPVAVSGAPALQPPAGLQLRPTSVPMPASLFPAALPGSQLPAGLLCCPQTLLAQQLSVVAPQWLPHNMVLVQAAQGSVVHSSLVVGADTGSLLLPAAASGVKMVPPQASVVGGGSGLEMVPPQASVVGGASGVQILQSSSVPVAGTGLQILSPPLSVPGAGTGVKILPLTSVAVSGGGVKKSQLMSVPVCSSGVKKSQLTSVPVCSSAVEILPASSVPGAGVSRIGSAVCARAGATSAGSVQSTSSKVALKTSSQQPILPAGKKSHLLAGKKSRLLAGKMSRILAGMKSLAQRKKCRVWAVASSAGSEAKSKKGAEAGTGPAVTVAQGVGRLKPDAASPQVQGIITAPGGARLLWIQGGLGTSHCPANAAPLLTAAPAPSAGPFPLGPSASLTGAALTPSLPGVSAMMARPLLAPASASTVRLPATTPSPLTPSQMTPSQVTPPQHSKQATQAVAAVGGCAVTPRLQQNKPSNIVLLPPVLAQGYVLNGIRMQGPGPSQSTHTSSAARVPNVQPETGQSCGRAAETEAKDSCVRNWSVSGSDGVDAGWSPAGAGEPSDARGWLGKSQTPCAEARAGTESGSVGAAAKGPRGKSSWLSLTLWVEDRPEDCSAAQVSVVLEFKVAELARMLLTGVIEQHCPVVLDDGRAFLPLTYTGPYVPKNTKTFFRKDDSGMQCMVEKSNKLVDGSGESRKSTIQSVKLFGKVVWLFLDYDGPQIMWKLEGKDNHVLVLPLDKGLPPPALREIRRMVLKYQLVLPPGVDPFRAEQAVTSTEGAKPSSRPAVLQEKSGTGPVQPVQRCPHSSQAPATHTKRKLSASGAVDKGSLCAVGASGWQSETQRHECIDSHSERSQRPAGVSEGEGGQGSGAAGGNQGRAEGGGRTCTGPQLIVRETARVIQRALEAVVRLERLPLTEGMLQQLNTDWRQKDARQTDGLQHCPEPLPPGAHITEDLASKLSSDTREQFHTQNNEVGEMSVRKEKSNLAQAKQKEQHSDSERIDMNVSELEQSLSAAVLNSGLFYDKETGRDSTKQLVESEDCREVEGCSRVTGGWQEETEAKRRKRSDSGRSVNRRAERRELGSRSSSTGAVRRSYRILGQPRPDYLLLQQGYKDVERDGQQAVWGGGASPPAVHTPTAAQRPGSQSGDPGSKMGSEGSLHGDQPDGREEEEARGQAQCDAAAEATEEDPGTGHALHFLQLHREDFRAVVLKAGSPASDTTSGQLRYLCRICKCVQSRSIEEVVAHLTEHYSGALRCGTCRFKAVSQQQLSEHEALEHTGRPLYQCPVCHTPFFSQAVFRSHLKRHKAVNTTCPACGIGFPSLRQLEMHSVHCRNRHPDNSQGQTHRPDDS